MQTMIARACGLDVHKAQLTACVRLLVDGVVSEVIQTFGTTTSDLLALRDWLGRTGSRMSRWSPPACIGSACTTCWRTSSSCCW